MPFIKRYSNRKLYDTELKRYITLDDIAGAIRKGEDVHVVDHDTGEDLTSITLLQVIFEEEKKIGGLLPQVVLSRMIRTGGETMNSLRSFLTSIDPLQVIDEEIKRRIKTLVEHERISEEEGQHLIDLLARKPARADVIRIPVKNEDGEEVQPAQEEEEAVNTSVEVDALSRQVQALEQELERLKQANQAA